MAADQDEQKQPQEVQQLEQDQQQPEQQEPSGQVEVTLLIPKQDWLLGSKSDDGQQQQQRYTQLALALGYHDLVQDLRQLVLDTTDGFALGSFGFVPCQAAAGSGDKDADWTDLTPPSPNEGAEADDDKPFWRLTPDGTLGDYTDVQTVFPQPAADSPAQEQQQQRWGLRVVETTFTPLATASHLIRLRDALNGALLPEQPQGAYDPASLAIDQGASVFLSLDPDSQDASAPTPRSRSANNAAAAKTAAAATSPFQGWSLAKADPLAPAHLLQAQKSAKAAPRTGALRSLGVSAWSPPPHAWRLRGHHVYLVAVLEGETAEQQLHITGAASGFFVNKSTNHVFDPRAKDDRAVYQSLAALLCAHSGSFKRALVRLVQSQNPAHVAGGPAIFATFPVSNAVPASPWVVPAPEHTPDALRTQLAYLLTGSTSADTLPAARDWNDEFVQCKEMPRESLQERTLRERLFSRLSADFALAAQRCVQAVARGDVAPVNPNDRADAPTYVHAHMLVTRIDAQARAYEHLGGTRAARVGFSKDLRALAQVERADVENVHTLASVMVDYRGERYVVQSLLPGLFKVSPEAPAPGETTAEDEKDDDVDQVAPGDAFRIVYGGANPDEPDERVRASQRFHEAVKPLARELMLAEHTVRDSQQREKKLWLSTDVHGVAAPDGRNYLIDVFRMHPMDVTFLEEFCEAGKYPHKLVLLRPELVRAFYDSKLQPWIEDKIKQKRAEKGEGEGSETLEDVQLSLRDFELAFNPDAFVPRKPTTEHPDGPVIFDEQDESTKNVRSASEYLRSHTLASFITDVVDAGIFFSDGFYLTRLLHRKGINMRYLGLLATKVANEGSSLEFARTTARHEIPHSLDSLKGALEDEMVSRSCKHLLAGLLRTSAVADHAHIVAHFLNCLVPSSAPAPSPPHSSAPADRSWTKLDRASLEKEIRQDVQQRFLYELAPEWFEKRGTRTYKLVRELCLRSGVQLLARDLDFIRGQQQPALTNGMNGLTNGEAAPAATTSSLKKKKGSKAAAPRKLVEDAPYFTANDVLNLGPVVKQNAPRPTLADEHFDLGRRAIIENQLEVGQDLVTDALTLYEQIHGAVHPELATRYHSLGIMYHNIVQSLSRKIQLHDAAEDHLKNIGEDEKRAEERAKCQEVLLDDVEAARNELVSFEQSALRMIRQSIVISERTLGLDAHETVQYYSDLGLLEHSSGNHDAALRYTMHALNLWTCVARPYHPLIYVLLANASAMVQAAYGPAAALEVQKQVAEFASSTFGDRAPAHAAAQHSLAQSHALTGDFATALTLADEAHKMYDERLGADAKETREALAFANMLRESRGEDERVARAREERLRRRWPRLAATQAGATGAAGRLGAQPATASPQSEVTVRPHGEMADRSVDELVKYIQGQSPAGKRAKTMPKPKPSKRR